ncbi:MAG: penicillin-binding protein 2 [Deltaproteobacteria bacterium]|nr:penicillin-binding protein 2 [Deltaproteobacteria bacterium]
MSSHPTIFSIRWRIWALLVLMLIGLGVIALKAGRLQLVLGEDLRHLAENQYMRKLKVSAPRGSLLDRTGRPMAVTVPVFSVSTNPSQVTDAMDVAAKLAPILKMEIAKLERKLLSRRRFVYLKRRISGEVAEEVRGLALHGIRLEKEKKRFYPLKETAGHIVGMVDYDGDGISGAERAFDEYLRGRSVVLPGLRDNRKQHVALSLGVDLEVLNGDDVYLTIDSQLQHRTELALIEAVAENDAKGAWAIVMDPKTGALLAVANVPSFNPNDPKRGRQRNQALSSTFEPGSIFKVITFAAAIDEEVLDPNKLIFCENGNFKLGKFTIRDSHKAGWLTGRDVFRHSSNIGSMKIALSLGEEKFKRNMKRFGFGEVPGVGFLEEAKGRVRKARWGETRLGTTGYGHGISVTALQMVRAVAAIANGGIMPHPQLLSRVEAQGGSIVLQGEKAAGVRVVSEKTAKVLSEIMTGVVASGGTGVLANIRGVRVAGKTGTAEKVDPKTGRYMRKVNMTSFIGFAPAENPEVVAIVVVDEPKTSRFGGTTAGPAFRKIVESALVHRGVLTATEVQNAPKKTLRKKTPSKLVPKDKKEHGTPTLVVKRGFIGLSAKEAMLLAKDRGLVPRILGSGLVVEAKKLESHADSDDVVIELTLRREAHLASGNVSKTQTPGGEVAP